MTLGKAREASWRHSVAGVLLVAAAAAEAGSDDDEVLYSYV